MDINHLQIMFPYPPAAQLLNLVKQSTSIKLSLHFKFVFNEYTIHLRPLPGESRPCCASSSTAPSASLNCNRQRPRQIHTTRLKAGFETLWRVTAMAALAKPGLRLVRTAQV